MRHGCEPWADLAVKLMLKWPNLYYSTTAFAPKYYPEDIVNYANTRGADKIIWSRLLPRRPHLRPHLRRAARRAVPRPRLAEVPPRERDQGLQARRVGAHAWDADRCTGIKVIELPNIGPTQFAGMALGDLGAEVLRLDRATSVASGQRARCRRRRTRASTATGAVDGHRPEAPRRRRDRAHALRARRRAHRGLPARRRRAARRRPRRRAAPATRASSTAA